MKKSKSKSSSSIQVFRNDLNDILNTLIAITRYRYLITFFENEKNKHDIPKEIYEEFISPIHKFDEQNLINNYLFIGVITTMETYLKNRLIEELTNYPDKKTTLLKQYNLNRKLNIDDILNGIEPIINEILNNVIYHNFQKVDILYKILLEINILSFIPNNLWNLIKIRHELVHRNGYINEKKLLIRELTLINSMTEISGWVENIDFYYREGRTLKKLPSFLHKYERMSKKYLQNEFFTHLMIDQFKF